MADVFISYQHSDRAAAERVAARLKDEGLSTWWDTSLVAGDVWTESIRAELRAAKVVIVLWSNASWASRWVQAEALAGNERGCLVSARLDDIALEPPFNLIQAADLRDHAAGLTSLLEGVYRKLGRASQHAYGPPSLNAGSFGDTLRRFLPALTRSPRSIWLGVASLALAGAGTVYWLWSAEPTSPLSTTSPAEVASVAVLPFANLSPDKEEAYFADGMADEIINILSKINGIRVVSRTSSFAFRKKDVALSEIAKRLLVRHIVEGSVRRANGGIRISAKLIDVQTDSTVWSDSFERESEHVFAVQDDIARAIAGALNVELSASARPRTAPTNIEAYHLYLKARELFLRRSKDDVLNSIDLYRRAIALDRSFAEAHLGLAASLLAEATKVEGTRNYVRYRELAPLARQSAEQARLLEPGHARGHALLGAIAAFEARWEEAHTHLSRAIALDPSDSIALGWLMLFQLQIGSLADAERTIAKVNQIDPLYSLVAVRAMVVPFVRGDDVAANALAEKVLQSSVAFRTSASWVLACTAQANGNFAAAEKHFRAFMEASGGRNSGVIMPVIEALRAKDAQRRAVKALKEEERLDPTFEPERLYLLIGADADFINSLRVRVARGEVGRAPYMWIFAWRLVSLRRGDDARLKTLMRELGLVAYWRRHGWPDRCRPRGEDDFACN
jgi:TolB-like protein